MQAELFAAAHANWPWEEALQVPESRPIPRDGVFAARILAVEPGGRALTFDRIQVFISSWGLGDEERAAREDGAPQPEGGAYVRNRVHERKTLPLSASASVVLFHADTRWSEGDPSERSINPRDGLSLIAVPPRELAARFATDSTVRSTLRGMGAVLVIRDGRIVVVKGNYSP